MLIHNKRNSSSLFFPLHTSSFLAHNVNNGVWNIYFTYVFLRSKLKKSLTIDTITQHEKKILRFKSKRQNYISPNQLSIARRGGGEKWTSSKRYN